MSNENLQGKNKWFEPYLPYIFAVACGFLALYVSYNVSLKEAELEFKAIHKELSQVQTVNETQQQYLNNLYRMHKELEADAKNSQRVLEEFSESVKEFTEATNRLSLVVARMDERLKTVEKKLDRVGEKEKK